MYRKFIKRALDIILSLCGIAVLGIPMAVCAVIVKVTSPGPVLFWQKRVGKDKKTFMMPKFRTMYTETPANMPTHLLSDPQKLITPTGRWFRKLSLDELPQLFSILTGKMSVIGPRPALWNQDDLIAAREAVGANSVRPGLTGWAQINGRDELEIDVKAALDGEYVRRLSFGFDVRCFFGTVGAVLGHRGVVEGGTGTMGKQKKKKLLVITNHSYMLYRFRKELIAQLSESYEVVISTPFVGHEEDFLAMGLKCINTRLDRRSINPFRDFRLFRTYRKMLRTERPDLCITYSIKPNIYGGIACRMARIPYCANVQGLGSAFGKKWLSVIVTGLYKAAFKKVSRVFFENQPNADLFRAKGICPAEKQTVLRGAGINLQEYACVPYPQNEKLHFLYLGRIMREKGMDELFYAVEKLREKHGDCFVLDLVGFFEDEYAATVDRLSKEGIAVFHGFCQDPRPYYAEADCVVLPSYHEGMSNVLLEAAATARPIITSDIPGCREAVDKDVSGYLCPKADRESLLSAMEKMLTLTAAQREEMGLSGREKMEREFEKHSVVSRTVNALPTL